MIHIVMGRTGEYDDREFWAVVAFHSKRKASNYAKLATAQAAAAFAALPSKYSELPAPIALDPGIRMDYTGTSYNVLSVKIGD